MQLADKLKMAMRRLASGVCVVNSQKGSERYAMTASSVTSLTDSPASLLVCVNKSAAIQPLLNKDQPFAVSVLGSNQEDISNKCAEKDAGDDRFSVGTWDVHEPSGLSYLTESQAIFFCEVDNENHEYGTHQIVIGRITDIIIPDSSVDPLIYLNGAYQQLK